MTRFALTAVLVASLSPLPSGDVAADTAAAPGAGPPTPVLVELFTSEGCSSCPPADALLSRLVATQPIANVEVVALGEHVDYWDRLGWPDRFSSAAYTRRQSDYQRSVFGMGTIYTPQVVIDGTDEALGSDAAALRRAVQRAAQQDKVAVRVTLERAAAGAVGVTVAVDAVTQPRAAADIVIAAVEDGLTTRVERGENRGRTLRHSAVVRYLEVAGPLGPLGSRADAGELATTVPLADEWNPANLRVVAFVQERRSHRVLGIGTATVADAPAATRVR